MSKESQEESWGLKVPLSRRNLILRLGSGMAVASALPSLQRAAIAQTEKSDIIDEDPRPSILPTELERPRTLHTMTALDGGRLLVTGGVSGGVALSSAELYYPGEGWVPMEPMNVARSQHAAVLLSNGFVMVIGGFGTAPLASSEIYNPDSNSWSYGPELKIPRYQHAADVQDGSVIVSGGVYHAPLAGIETLFIFGEPS